MNCPYGAWGFVDAVSTKMSLRTELGDTPHPIRLAGTGNPSGPSLYHLLEVMEKEQVMGRIERAVGLFS